MERKKRAAIYCRTAAGDEFAMEMQEALLMAAAKRNGLQEVSVYKDCGYPGTALERPALQKLMEDIREGRISMVLVKNADRIARTVEKAAVFLRTAQDSGVGVFQVAGNRLEEIPAVGETMLLYWVSMKNLRIHE